MCYINPCTMQMQLSRAFFNFDPLLIIYLTRTFNFTKAQPGLIFGLRQEMTSYFKAVLLYYLKDEKKQLLTMRNTLNRTCLALLQH